MSSVHRVLVWSSGRVLASDPVSNSMTERTDLVGLGGSGSAIVLIAHRSCLVRTVPLPNVGPRELVALLRSKLSQILPTGMLPAAISYRMAKPATGAGKTGIVGAVREDTFRRMVSEAKAADLEVALALPAPFATWLVAIHRGVRNGCVLSQEGGDLCLDVISDGELKYSRFCSDPGNEMALRDEVEQTLAIAGVAEGVVLCLGNLQMSGAESEPRGLGSLANSVGELRGKMVALELPEVEAARVRRREALVAQRAVAAACFALAIWGALLYQRAKVAGSAKERALVTQAAERGRKRLQSEVAAEAAKARTEEQLMSLAFRPAQRFGDLLAVIGRDSDEKSWLTGLSMERGKPISLRGQSRDGKAVSRLAAKLSSEPRLRDVKLLFTNKTQVRDTPVIQFAISGVAVGNLPFDRAITRGTGKR